MNDVLYCNNLEGLNKFLYADKIYHYIESYKYKGGRKWDIHAHT